MSETQKTEKIFSKKQQDAQLTASIMHALDTDRAFKMFSYRIIDADTFNAEINQLKKNHNDAMSLVQKMNNYEEEN